jgi:ATP-dependent RNA helicase SUPV3L1/SUV3
MSEPEATPADGAPPDAPAARAFDPGVIRGLQLFAPAGEAAADGLDEAARKEAIVQALAARASRFAEAVDDALTLASDGAIRWLGDPIGKLIVGVGSLEPGATLLADEALPSEGREAAQRRLSLWLAAYLHRVLGPLIALADAQGASEAARSIALKVSQALGVLERERVKAEVKALDQEARGALRKLGVRFGAHYIYVPALLKPAARTLCAQLWALAQPGVDQDGAERLLHFAASGRTSFAAEPPASAELCRIAGFRLCGDRAVRVDIVERLSDLIRAALPRSPTPGPADEADGFVVTGQMTSLTGCSGEPFASILRSLGFVAHQVKKSAYLAAIARRAAAAAASVAEVAVPPAAEGETAPAAAEPIATEGAAPVEEAAVVDAAASVEAPKEAEAAGEPVAVEAAPVAEVAVPPAAEGETAPAAAEPIATEGAAPVEEAAVVDAAASVEAPKEAEAASEPVAVETAPPAAAVAVSELAAAPDAIEPAPAPVADAAESALSSSSEAVAPEASLAEAGPSESAPTEASPAEAAPAEEEEMIEVWRPAPRRPRHAPHHHRNRDHHPQRIAATVEGGVSAQDGVRLQEGPRLQDGRGRKPWRERQASGNASGEDARPAAAAGEARGDAQPGEGRRGPPQWRRDAGARGDRRDDRRPRDEEAKRPDKDRPRPPPAEPRVNLDSPFAKLLALKPLLQGRDKNQ